MLFLVTYKLSYHTRTQIKNDMKQEKLKNFCFQKTAKKLKTVHFRNSEKNFLS